MGRGALYQSWVAGTVVLAGAIASAEDFHVESRVFSAGETKPVIQTTTLFYKGVVYDFMKDPNGGKDPEATIFDPAHSRCVVLDPQRKICTELSLEQVQTFSKELRLEAAAHQDPLLNFLSNPQFTEKSEGDELEFTSSWMVYRLKTTPAKSPEIAHQYAEFSFWLGQLNVMLNPASLPPFGRIAVSEKLEQRKLLPTEVFMTISPKGPTQKLTLRAEHHFQWTIRDSDRKLVDETHKQLASFRQVSLKEYNSQRAVGVAQAPQDKTKKK